MVKKFWNVLQNIQFGLKHSNEVNIHKELDRLRKERIIQNEKNLAAHGFKVYSQNEEDGIIQEIFHRIGVTNKTFVEFGIGTGLENNTLALLFKDWKGLWIDASKQSVATVKKNFEKIIENKQLKVVESFITRDNINELISSNISDKTIDLISVDIDGNDYHILDAIICVKPRVIVIEYNAKFAPPIMYCMGYNETHTWDGSDHFGVSLKYLEVNLAKKGYKLVGCNLVGCNAFFVQEQLINDKFQEEFTAEYHFEPARYYLGIFSSGHPASYRTLINKL
ncbi:hypothetical protein [uncultured Draconibacterium sp.]|uniref:hypothetical protein n=1 Tax=uncultured Draconibacterium sp. TaxID=1573823 RepID=UPI003217211A